MSRASEILSKIDERLYDTRLHRDMITRETDKAFGFHLPGTGGGTQYSRGGQMVFLPKSHVRWHRPGPQYGETAHVPEWLARKLTIPVYPTEHQ